MGFWRKLIGKPQPVTTTAMDARIAHDLNSILLGHEPTRVPLQGSTGSRASRAYVCGLVEAIIQHYRGQGLTDAEEQMAFTSGFLAVYGAANVNAVGKLTFDEIKADEPASLHGLGLGVMDAEAFYAGEAMSGPLGFWTLNNDTTATA